MSERLAGRTAMVTGAGSGIGRRVALRFVAEGARVFFADRDPAAAQEAADQAGPGAVALEMDITDESSVAAGYARVVADVGPPQVVVANAGVQLFGRDARVADLDLDAWRRTVEVNLTGTFLTVKHAVRAMLGSGGSIILTGSPTALNGEGQDFTAYSSTKAGIHGMGRAVAAAYAGDGIRVNVVVPGYTETALVAAISDSPEERAAIIGRIPVGRAGRPEDVEGIMVYLASEESSFATGATFVVDGGMTTL